MSAPATQSVSYKEVKEKDKPAYWVAMVNGQVVAKAMSEQGVRSLVTTIIEKNKKAQKPEAV